MDTSTDDDAQKEKKKTKAHGHRKTAEDGSLSLPDEDMALALALSCSAQPSAEQSLSWRSLLPLLVLPLNQNTDESLVVPASTQCAATERWTCRSSGGLFDFCA